MKLTNKYFLMLFFLCLIQFKPTLGDFICARYNDLWEVEYDPGERFEFTLTDKGFTSALAKNGALNGGYILTKDNGHTHITPDKVKNLTVSHSQLTKLPSLDSLTNLETLEINQKSKDLQILMG
jgi:Leucine-rich repeat (LRR) protein